MSSHRDILDEHEPLRTPFLSSMLLHGGVAALIVGWSTLGGPSTERWGDPKSLGGGSVAIQVESSLKMVTEGRRNPVANDTRSQIPSAPSKPQPVRAPMPEPEAIPLPGREKQTGRTQQNQQRYNPERRDNQVYTRDGQAASSTIYSPSSGGGGVGSGSSSPFGARLGWYEQLLRERVSRNWRAEELDARLRNLPPAVVTFELLRDGSIRNVRVAQSSGNFALDQSAQRAIIQSAPFPALPPQFERNSANLEFLFRLQR
jgi:periplasmic protein TonB